MKRHSTIKSSHKRSANYSSRAQERKSGTNRYIMHDNYNELNELQKDNVGIYRRNSNLNNESLIKTIQMNSCCYYFLSKKKNMDVNLLGEGMKVITERLDIMNIFVKLYQDEKVQEKILSNFEGIRMSDECIYNIDILKNEKDNVNNNDDESNNV